MIPFAVAINRQFIGKRNHGDPGWRAFNNAFHPEEVTIVELARAVYKGHAHCVVHDHISHRKQGKAADGAPFEYDGAYRDIQNFRAMQTACLDFDKEDPQQDGIDALLLDSFIAKRAGLLYSTTSSKPLAPRTRVVFVLEKPITAVDDARLFNKALVGGYPRADQSGSDVMKPWSGSIRCQTHFNHDALIPASIVDGMVYHARRVEEELKEKRKRYLDGMTPDVIRDKLRAALRFVPTKMDYNDWFKVLVNIWLFFPSEEGVAIAEEWSPGLPGEISRKFRLMRNPRLPPDWVFGVAYNRGWRDPNAPTFGQDEAINWILQQGGQ